MENTREQKLKYIFGANQNVEEFFVTSDDQAFRSENDATNHAKTLTDGAVKRERRVDYLDIVVEKTDPKAEAKAARTALFARHEELFGIKPAKTAKTADVKSKIDAEEARIAEVAKKEADVSGSNQSDEEE